MNLVRPPIDHRVDRPDVDALQGAELTGTNRPRACPHNNLQTIAHIHCAALNHHTPSKGVLVQEPLTTPPPRPRSRDVVP